MLNQVILVGRIVDIRKSENRTLLNLCVPRSFKNENGEYENDIIKCVLMGNIATNTLEYCRHGDLIGIKGRLQSVGRNDILSVVAEKVTFLSSKKVEEE